MHFEKYHGCGNDFIIIPYRENISYQKMAVKLCNRYIGIGADGLIIVKDNPLEMIIYNKDGTRAPMCGNGIRCFARYCFENGIVKKKRFDVLTLSGIMKIEIVDIKPFMIKVNMGKPIFDNKTIKVDDTINSINRIIKIDEKKYVISSLFLGTIHTVLIVEDMKDVIKTDLGYKICNNPLFKEKTNVNFVQIIDRKNVLIRTYERGVGFTYACGTGASASYVVLRLMNKIDEKLTVHLKYGNLVIEGNEEVFMTGPATRVYSGETEDFLC